MMFMKHPNVLDMVAEALKAKGFDGLHYEGECGCSVDDLAPCGQIDSHCEAGYKVIAPSGKDYDFYICHDRMDKPWEY